MPSLQSEGYILPMSTSASPHWHTANNSHSIVSAGSGNSAVTSWLDGHPAFPDQYLGENNNRKRKRGVIDLGSSRRPNQYQVAYQLSKRRRRAIGALAERSLNAMEPQTRRSGRKTRGLPVHNLHSKAGKGAQTLPDPDKTPVPRRQIPPLHGPMDPAPLNVYTDGAAKTSEQAKSVASSSLGSSSRASSPTKHLMAYKLSDMPINLCTPEPANIPPEVTSLVREWKRIGNRIHVVPPDSQTILKNMQEEVEDFNLMKEEDVSRYDWSSATFARTQEIYTDALQCEIKYRAEPAWNSAVHFPLLRLALSGYWQTKGIWFEETTTARISDRHLLPSLDGLNTQSKMVDYVITIGSADGFEKRVITKLKKEAGRPGPDPTINQTSVPYLRFNPIAVSIETKRAAIDEEKARIQLSGWIAAQFSKLEELGVSHRGTLPVMPLLMVQGHAWKMLLAISNPDQIEIVSSFFLGETSSMIGLFCVIAGIRRLAKWIDESYRPWFEENILVD